MLEYSNKNRPTLAEPSYVLKVFSTAVLKVRKEHFLGRVIMKAVILSKCPVFLPYPFLILCFPPYQGKIRPRYLSGEDGHIFLTFLWWEIYDDSIFNVITILYISQSFLDIYSWSTVSGVCYLLEAQFQVILIRDEYLSKTKSLHCNTIRYCKELVVDLWYSLARSDIMLTQLVDADGMCLYNVNY